MTSGAAYVGVPHDVCKKEPSSIVVARPKSEEGHRGAGQVDTTQELLVRTRPTKIRDSASLTGLQG